MSPAWVSLQDALSALLTVLAVGIGLYVALAVVIVLSVVIVAWRKYE